MDDLEHSLAQIEAELKRLGRDFLVHLLKPGIPGEEVRSLLGSVGFTENSELLELYGWHNGTSTAGVAAVGDIQLFPGFYLLSVEDAIVNYRTFVTDARWVPGWLPIFGNGGGDFYIVDLSSAVGDPVHHFRIEESEHPIEFSSLSAMLSTLAQAFKRGIFFVDPSGYLEMDDFAFGSLAAELNPDVAWWAD